MSERVIRRLSWALIIIGNLASMYIIARCILLPSLERNDYPYTPPACQEGEVFSEEEGCQRQTGFVLTVINN